MRTLMSILLLGVWLTSCQQEKQIERQVLSLDKTATILQGKSLFKADSNHYFYDIKSAWNYLAFLDDSCQTVLSVYAKDNIQQPVFTALRGRKKGELQKPHFRQEVTEENGFLLVNDNSRYMKLYAENGDWILQQEEDWFNVKNSFYFNRTEKELYAVPYAYEMPYPFYYYNPEEGYYWVDADSTVMQILSSHSDAYLCNLCVNEKEKVVAAAYRFTNAISFYDLEGNIQKHIRLGDIFFPITKDMGVVDVENTPKCFLDIYGTEQYIYTVYSEESDTSLPTYLLLFTWDGSLARTWKFDRNIRSISVENDKYLYGIRTLPDGSQEVCEYILEIENK